MLILPSNPSPSLPRFTRADLTFAALASPLLNLSQFPNSQRLYARLPPALKDMSSSLRSHPAGLHAIRCYEEYRGGSMGKDGRVTKGVMKAVRVRQGQRNRMGAIAGIAAGIGAGTAALVGGVLGTMGS